MRNQELHRALKVKTPAELTEDQLTTLAAKCDELASALIVASEKLPARTLGACRIVTDTLTRLSAMLEADGYTAGEREKINGTQ
jgi:hypothetical protein